VKLAVDLRCLTPQHLHIFERAIAETTARDRRPAAAVTGLGEREIHEPVLLECRAQRQIEQAALAARRNLRHTFERRGNRAACVDRSQTTGALADEHRAIRQQSETPWMLETLRDRDDIERPGLRLRLRRARR